MATEPNHQYQQTKRKQLKQPNKQSHAPANHLQRWVLCNEWLVAVAGGGTAGVHKQLAERPHRLQDVRHKQATHHRRQGGQAVSPQHCGGGNCGRWPPCKPQSSLLVLLVQGLC